MNRVKRFIKDEGGMGVVEVILIIVVLISLVLIFKTQITAVVKSIFIRQFAFGGYIYVESRRIKTSI